ncbi:phosphate ABC transporter permease subunit PstC [Nocardioides rubriscoriae]|uniref:phosphate ABC transporter permease subunit PstC n=1 Tax=Nocardioides rubriscoriae TaxID=642762 RepID=UPI001FE96342|nr:phosphate ABC transporter permease subunit PstC [Nocardioides rubriscoriae]
MSDETAVLDPVDLPTDPAPDTPRQVVRRRSLQDLLFVHSVRGAGLLVLVVTGSIGVFLGISSVPTLQHYGLSYFTEFRWIPSQDVIGISGALIGTVEVALLALCFAIPLSLLTALFITDWAPARLRPTLVLLVDMMAAVPGIIFGLWVLFLIQPHAAHVAHWLSTYFGWIPFFHVRTDVDYPIWNQLPGYPSYAGSAFIAAIAVTMMIFPMATSVMREVFGQAPVGEKEAALALGATRWAMVRTVVLPFGRSGVIGGTMLALGRALGETISVVLVLQLSFERKPYVLENGNATISATIAAFFKEADAAQLSALLTAGFVLFGMTLLVNSIAAGIVSRSRGSDVTDL